MVKTNFQVTYFLNDLFLKQILLYNQRINAYASKMRFHLNKCLTRGIHKLSTSLSNKVCVRFYFVLYYSLNSNNV